MYRMTMSRAVKLVLGIMSILLVEAHRGQSAPLIIDRHNFGITLIKRSELQLATASANLVFHYELPPRTEPKEERINCSRFTEPGHPLRCRSLLPILQVLQNLHSQASKHLEDRLSHIYDVLYDFADRRTAKRGFFSSVLWKITGLAQQDDLNRLADLMRKVESGVQKAAEAWQSGSSHFTAAVQIEKKRVDNIYALLAMQRQSMLRFQSQFLESYWQANSRTLLIARVTESLASVIYQTAETEDIFQAVQLLSIQKLPHFFITHDILIKSLNYLQWYLNNTRPELTVLRQDVKYYFHQGKFNVFRHNRQLVIVLKVPLTLHELTNTLDVLELQKIPLLSPNSADHYTMLATDFDVIAYHRDVEYYLTAPQLSDVMTDILDLRTTTVILRQRSVPTCALQLIEGDLQQIKSHCVFHVITGPLPRGVFRLTERSLLFSNITKVTVRCRNNDTVQTFTPHHIQTVYDQHCACQISADEFFVPEASLHCQNPDNMTFDFTPKFLINLPFLSAFVDQDALQFLRDNTFLNRTIPAILPELPIASKNYEAKLAVEKSSRYNLEVLVNQTRQDSYMYEGLSHFLYNNLLLSHTDEASFDVLNPYHWLMAIASIAGILALVLAVFLHCKIRTLFVLLSKTGHARALGDMVQGPMLPTMFHVKTTTQPLTTTLDPLRFHKAIKELLPVDITLLFCLVLFILGFIGYLYCRYRKSKTSRTSLVIEISDGKKTLNWKIGTLPLNAGFYEFVMSADLVNVRLTEMFLTGILGWGDCLSVRNKTLNLPIPLKSQVTLLPWQVAQVRGIMMNDFYLVLYVTAVDDEVLEIVIIHNSKTQPLVGGGMSKRLQRIYPALDTCPV